MQKPERPQGLERQGRQRRGGRARKGLAVIFAINWLIIGIISAIDCYWSIRLQEVLYEHEQNPVGRWLIDLGGGDIALFMMCKIIGTTISLGCLVLLYIYKESWAHISCFCVCIFQLLLLAYLYYGNSMFSNIIT